MKISTIIFDNPIAVALLPLIPLILGNLAKFAVVDEVYIDPYAHLKINYLDGAWIQLLSICFVAIGSWLYASKRHLNDDIKELNWIFHIPVITGVICLAFRLGGPKLNLNNDIILIYCPLFLSLITTTFVTIMLREVTK